jgi:DNA repair protein RecN (Recombination protein N)
MGPDETMIKSLRVRNLATIEDLELRMESGFSILTGETGAGKSIIIDAIRLALGEKASSDLVRTGKKDAGIEAVFEVTGLPEGLEDLPPAEDAELLVQRQISDQGTGKAYVNGVLVPVRRLKDLGPKLVDIYGQNDHVFLLHLENHLRYLDAFLADPGLLRDVAHLAQELRRLVQEKKDLESRERERDERLDFLAFQVREIEAARLRPGEDADLLREREILRNSEKIAGLIDRALDIAYVREDSLVPLLARLQTVLAELGRFDDSLRNLQAGLQESSVILKDVADSLIRFKDRRSESAGNLEAVEERLSAIEKVKRKHGGTIEAALERLEGLRREQAALASNQERLSDIETELGAKFRDYSELARKLGALRRKAAKKLEGLIEEEISLLGMKKARFSVRIASAEPSVEDTATIRDLGAEDVEFLISPNPGEELRPLRRIASGGELSRIMLALKSVGKETESRKTLIFDEIDSGIGGKTAEFIAQKLRQLAARHQVICITHLPQIASTALHHFRVEKKIEKERTFTLAKLLGRDERVTEIARLISGSRLTDASLEIAREMLDHNLGRERTRS